MQRLLTLIALLCVGMAGCSMFEERDQTVLMPLSVGNSWTYLVTESRQPVARLTYRVVDHIDSGPMTFAEIEMSEVPLGGGDTTVTSMYAVNELGLSFYKAPRLGSEVIDYFRHPVERHDRYWSPNGNQMCTSRAEEIAVPAGSFDVLIYGPCENFDANRSMFAPETGMTYSGDYDARALHLSSFELK